MNNNNFICLDDTLRKYEKIIDIEGKQIIIYVECINWIENIKPEQQKHVNYKLDLKYNNNIYYTCYAIGGVEINPLEHCFNKILKKGT